MCLPPVELYRELTHSLTLPQFSHSGIIFSRLALWNQVYPEARIVPCLPFLSLAVAWWNWTSRVFCVSGGFRRALSILPLPFFLHPRVHSWDRVDGAHLDVTYRLMHRWRAELPSSEGRWVPISELWSLVLFSKKFLCCFLLLLSLCKWCSVGLCLFYTHLLSL